MPKFQYEGHMPDGKRVYGEIEADNEDTAADRLISRNITPITLKGIKISQAFSFQLFLEKWGFTRVPAEELIIFSRQMYHLTKAGVSVLSSLWKLAETTQCRPLAKILKSVAVTISAGRNLTEAMREHPTVFSALYTNVIEVGENTGRMDDAFFQITNYLEFDHSTKKRVKAAMRYPTFVMSAIFIAIIVVNLLVIPAFSKMFSKFSVELPLPTRILIGMSNFFVENGYLILLGAIIFVIWFFQWIKTKKGRLAWDKLTLRFVIAGKLIRKIVLARFTRSFSMILEAGVPILKGITLSAWAVGNAYIAEQILTMRNGIERGESLSRVAYSSNLFPPLVLQMIEVGEETGNLGTMLKGVAEYYEMEVNYALENLSSSMEPILLGIIASMVLVLALGVFLPMWDMMSAIRGK
jgi:MSHA biogenesis protein MshG